MLQANVIHVLKRKIKSLTFILRKLFFGDEIVKNEIIELKVNKQKLEIVSQNGFESRNESTIIMFLQNYNSNVNFKYDKFNFYTGDYPRNFNKNCFYYCVDDESKLDNCIPDFSFYHWKEAGIYSYQDLRQELLNNSRNPPIHDRLFWAGNINTHKTRKDFYNKFKDDTSHFEIHHIDPRIPQDKKFTLLDHQKYKYLIDIQGNGFSARLKFLLHSGRLLFLQERKWKTFYHFKLIPFVHYIPVAEDFSDLREKLNWAILNEEEADKIAENAKIFAVVNLDYIEVCNVLIDRLIY